ncbi:alpha/beta fold hydrolase [Undibacterium squillarum]|uniref:Hydrolase n=1 Tax=Undibacterium squillarum TaxID=1131567 RepID=A0ABQ2XWF8_9BURK|nr:alpha/beta hydrolase [Undibacterium squillarum]GGX37745.1 hydrolase [Undibacterium squillarum]
MRERSRMVMWSLLALAVLAVTVVVAMNWAPDQPVQKLQDRWAAAPSRFVSVNGMQVHVRDEGWAQDPVPVLLIHGTSSSLHTWERWAKDLKKDHRVISFDLPGFGLTGPAPDNDYSIAAYLRFVQSLMDTLGVKKAIIAGNSLGGEIAWRFAADMPQRVEKLILLDASGYDFKPQSVPVGFQIARIPILAWPMDFLLPKSTMEDSVRDVYGNPEKVTPELIERYTAMTVRAGNRAALRKRLRQLQAGEQAALIKEVRVPTLILWGGKDKLIPPEYAEHFHQDIAGSKLIMFDELGHVPQEENPVVTLAAVKIFIQ